MSEKIKSISEAFSMQPVHHWVESPENYERNKRLSSSDTMIKEIIIKSIQTSPDIVNNYCVGYNFDGKKLFQYRQDAVNITFFPD